jgi:LysM repeat protein
MEKPVYHRLQRGETLELLSARYGVPVCMIVRANEGLRQETPHYGTTLVIPHKCWCNRCNEVPPVKAPPRWRYAEYVVQPDDTLYGISLRSGLTMRILQKANALSGIAELQPGTRMRIPAISGKRYYVREGESLADIAARHGVTEEALREMNFLEYGEQLGPGACLLI